MAKIYFIVLLAMASFAVCVHGNRRWLRNTDFDEEDNVPLSMAESENVAEMLPTRVLELELQRRLYGRSLRKKTCGNFQFFPCKTAHFNGCCMHLVLQQGGAVKSLIVV